MPDLRTEITEITTGLGMLGHDSIDSAIAARPKALTNVTDDHWGRITEARVENLHADAFAAAWTNGRLFLTSQEGLRGRLPAIVEWKGPQRPPGFDLIPADLRVDHVYLVSCKYRSKILSNSSPSNLFERRLADRTAGTSQKSWYAICAPDSYEHFYSAVRNHVGQHLLPPTAQDLLPVHVRRIRQACGGTWPAALAPLWAELSFTVAVASASRWLANLPTAARREEMVWRLLRLGPAPYFVLGSSDTGPLRLRIDTPWDWRQQFSLRGLAIEPVAAGQPRVGWTAEVEEKASGTRREAKGHVEIRWAHGRFSSVEAKIYLDTAHDEVPGYVHLATD